MLLDTDHLTVLSLPADARKAGLIERLNQAASSESIRLPIITVEEQLRGWLLNIAQAKNVRGQIYGYDRLQRLVDFLATWEKVGFDSIAADEFERLRKIPVRIGTQDLKIAAIALSRGERLLSANLRDFRRVPGLVVENWLTSL